ncbi:hypothetical protein [Streptomyces roseoviridis]|uniref:DUF3558 domain-containing protein n=1 Tax=Streptomyces roseoviridis TaxID=67361 RepID=A0ABV5QPZ9_9ACTN
MISEPELVGGPDFPAPAPGPAPTGTMYPPPPAATPPPAPPRSRRPWLWALGGAVAASALWAGGLAAYDPDDRPDLGGYRTDLDPCEAAKLEGLASALGPRGPAMDEPLKSDHPALFEWDCSVTLAAKPVPYTLRVSYTLHRVTDPGPEFEARRADPQLAGGGDRVGGIGELAYFGGVYGDDSLEVLDGQAVLRLVLEADEYDEEKDRPIEVPQLDPAAVQTYLVEDMQQLMKALKS